MIFIYLCTAFVFLPKFSPSSIVVISSQPFVSGKRKVTPPATSGKRAKPTGGNHGATACRSMTKGASMEPIRAHIEENPSAAFRTTVGNSSVQYKYATKNAMKLQTVPMLASATEPAPSGITARTSKHPAHTK